MAPVNYAEYYALVVVDRIHLLAAGVVIPHTAATVNWLNEREAAAWTALGLGGPIPVEWTGYRVTALAALMVL